jgi:hypothetical protein
MVTAGGTRDLWAHVSDLWDDDDGTPPFVIRIDDDGWLIPLPTRGQTGLLHLPNETPTSRKTQGPT